MSAYDAIARLYDPHSTYYSADSFEDFGINMRLRLFGIGALLGLHEPWREDAVALAAHALHLLKVAWRQELAVSVPRIRPSASGYSPEHPVADTELAQLICALRLVLPDTGIVMSTREAPGFRDALVPLGVTHTSAGSHTDPGGYTEPGEAEGQFEVDDTRAPQEVADALRALGYEPVWKDWDPTYDGNSTKMFFRRKDAYARRAS